ncbi:MAG: bisanhydrobacterioruberin hydratase CruF [Bacteroidota bacterium]
MPTPPPRTASTHRLFLLCLALFAGSILFSVAGTVLLNFFPAQAGVALGWIAANLGLDLDALIKGPTWVYMALLPVLSLLLYLPDLGWTRSVLFLLWGSAIGAVAELLGTQTGFPFGAYTYGDYLGAKLAGHVPWFIPPSWYAVAIIAYDLARRMKVGTTATIVWGAVFMVLWDVALDPAMSKAFPFWTYETEGIFFGMPLSNWAGWFVTSLLIVWGFDRLLGGLQSAPAWAPTLYALNVIFPVLICLLYGLPLAGLIGLVALGVALAVVGSRGGRLLPTRSAPEVARV